MFNFVLMLQSDAVLKTIAEASVQTASNTTFNTIDYISFIVAILALVIAFISLCYAVMTLRVSKRTLTSQVRTEKNTRKISFDTQSILLSTLMGEVFNRFATICAAHIYMDTHQYTNYPTRKYFNDLRISTTFIQTDSDTCDNNEIYIALAMLQEKVTDYNNLLPTYLDTLSNNENTKEIRCDAIESNLLSLAEIAETINLLFEQYYNNTSGDNIDSILSLPTTEFSKVPSYPVYHNLIANKHSTLNVFSNFFIKCITTNKEYKFNNRVVTNKFLLNHLGGVVAGILTRIDTWFFDFDLVLDVDNPYISTWSGLLLPMPSKSKKNRVNFGCLTLHMYENELRLISPKYDLSSPTFSYKFSDIEIILSFEEVRNEKGTSILYYRCQLEESMLVSNILPSEKLTISYMPVNIPSVIDKDSDTEQLYQTTLTGEEFTRLIYHPRITDKTFELTDSEIDKFVDKYSESDEKASGNNSTDDRNFEILGDDEGNLLLIINARQGEPDAPRFIIDHGQNCLLYRNKMSSVILYKVEKSVYDAIIDKSEIRVAEVENEQVQREYYAPIVVVKTIESLLA